ncbi:MAG: restriction endonuclease subunit S [Treponema sp.]|nr:restriction endonuclease subunit S [Treponema sp.]
MSEWKKVRLGDIATFSNGINFGKESYKAGVKLIGVSNFGNRFFPDYDELEEVDENVLRPNDYLKTGDIVFVRSNGNKELVGRCMLIQNPPSTVTYSGFCIRARLNNIGENCPSFFAYYFKSKDFRKAMSNTAVGANIQNLNQGLLSNHIFYLPPLETQQKIAGILSAYDDLIENNRKQIKLLEEAAQKLYKEWFVKLNFPGHENVKIVDGVPEGWKKGTVFDLGEFKRGKTITKDQTILGPIPVVAGGLEPAYYHNESNTDSPVITVSGSGANAGFTRMYYEKVWASDCSYLDISKCENLYFVYCILNNSKAEIDNLQKGAAQPHVYAKDVNAINTLIPCQVLLEKFSAVVKVYFEKIRAVQKQIIDLQSARDKLLPKLMNGEIDVK